MPLSKRGMQPMKTTFAAFGFLLSAALMAPTQAHAQKPVRNTVQEADRPIRARDVHAVEKSVQPVGKPDFRFRHKRARRPMRQALPAMPTKAFEKRVRIEGIVDGMVRVSVPLSAIAQRATNAKVATGSFYIGSRDVQKTLRLMQGQEVVITVQGDGRGTMRVMKVADVRKKPTR